MNQTLTLEQILNADRELISRSPPWAARELARKDRRIEILEGELRAQSGIIRDLAGALSERRNCEETK